MEGHRALDIGMFNMTSGYRILLLFICKKRPGASYNYLVYLSIDE